MRYEAALAESVHRQACDFLLSHLRVGLAQEELCFALWRPATGLTRKSALIHEIIMPLKGERHLHKNASFEPGYLARAIRRACAEGTGLAFMHNHLSGGWQDMSSVDVIAERDRIAPPARATGYPLVGLTLGTDHSWSARFWTWNDTKFDRSWCDKVRVVGSRLRITFNDRAVPAPKRNPLLRRTIDTWGEARQRDIARLRVGIVGVGSVGCMIAEALARMGVEYLVLIDPDRIESHNLDRILFAGKNDVGKFKTALAEKHLKNSATAENFHVTSHTAPIQTEHAVLSALDCDLLFSAVDRPLPKDLLNRMAYAHCIPVISGGVYIDNKPDGTMGQAAWSVSTVGPNRRCLRCDGQYSSSGVIMERDGSLDDPTYLRRAAVGVSPVNQNVFPFSANLASFMVIEMVRLIAADSWWPDIGGKLYYSMIPAQLKTTRAQCLPTCSICEKTMHGDGYRYPFLTSSHETVTDTSIWRKISYSIRRLVFNNSRRIKR